MFQAAQQVRAGGEAGWLSGAHLRGDPKRAGVTSINRIARWVAQAKGRNAAGQTLDKRTLWSVKECRKRMNARGA
jgi:hypothetical protein